MIIDAEGVIFTEESLRLDIAASAPRRACALARPELQQVLL